MAFLEAEHPLPFEEILAPFVLVAHERLAKRTAAFGGLHSEAARAALERSLLRSLSPASDELFLTEFETMRALTSVVATCYLLGVSTSRMDKLDVV